MNTKKITTLIVLAAALVALPACNDFLDEMPDNRTELDSSDKITSLLVSAYSEHTYPVTCEYASDNVDETALVSPNFEPEQEEYYRWQDVTAAVTNEAPQAVWSQYYMAIAAANQALDAIKELGGADMHSSQSGICDYAASSTADTIHYIKRLLSFVPQNNFEAPPVVPCTDPANRWAESLHSIIPDNPNAAYDMKDIIIETVDNGDFFEVKEQFAPNLIVGFARYNGISVGIVANQPAYLSGVLDIDSSVKGARFVRFCDCFNIPVVTFVDVPGFLPGTAQEYGGVIRNGAKILYAYAEATIPKVTVITRKAYGGAYCVMSSKHLRGDINYAWPSAEIAVMGSKGAAEVLYGRQARQSDDPKAFLAEKEEEYHETVANPYVAAQRGYIDDIIDPATTRARIIKALGILQNKRDTNPMKKHGNIPL